MLYWLAGAVAALSALGTVAYRRLWLRSKAATLTPSGFGVLFAPAVFGAAAALHAPVDLILACGLITIVTAVYWIDDASGLPIAFRLLLQAVTGALLAALLLGPMLGFASPLLWAACLGACLFNVVITNVVNFHDGADLNTATCILLVLLLVLFAGTNTAFLLQAAVIAIAFVVPFAVANSLPKHLYIGDAGCFAFSSLVTLGMLVAIRNGDAAAAFAFIPLVLPVFDVFYVIAMRITLKEDIFTRNFHHLYQQIQFRYRGFSYLLPQLGAAAAACALAALLQYLGVPTVSAVIVAAAAIVPAGYLFCRRVFTPGPDLLKNATFVEPSSNRT